jgi:hypothetical protein
MKIQIDPLGEFEDLLDMHMEPVMDAIAQISGAGDESSQITHYWNNSKLPRSLAPDKYLMCLVKGISEKVRKQGNIFMNALFHIPFLGGGKNYVVVSPVNIPEGGWYAGWHNEHVHGVSRILVHTPVRLLRGRDDCNFMGFDSEGNQILVRVVFQGKIGDDGPFRKLPLL